MRWMIVSTFPSHPFEKGRIANSASIVRVLTNTHVFVSNANSYLFFTGLVHPYSLAIDAIGNHVFASSQDTFAVLRYNRSSGAAQPAPNTGNAFLFMIIFCYFRPCRLLDWLLSFGGSAR